jgi:hypothetical protein
MGPSKDTALDQVESKLSRVPLIGDILGRAIRQGIDDVIQGPRTGRWNIADLEKTEKSYIGTRIEIEVRAGLGVERGKKLDYLIEGHEVDLKFSIKYGGWMIPREAQDEICLVLSANDSKHLFWAGLIRADKDVLRPGKNQDRKGSVSAAGRDKIRWLVREGKLAKNFFMHDLEQRARDLIFAQPPGQARVNELFLQCERRVIPGSAIVAAATEVDDSAPRVAVAAQELKQMEILDGNKEDARRRAQVLNIRLLPGHYVAICR